jgi:hypothetical protein
MIRDIAVSLMGWRSGRKRIKPDEKGKFRKINAF